MAVLSDPERAAVWAELMRDLSVERQIVNLTKDELRAAINAVDAWIDANQASFNSALPQAARSGLNAAQKARLLLFVVRRRFIKGV